MRQLHAKSDAMLRRDDVAQRKRDFWGLKKIAANQSGSRQRLGLQLDDVER
jgi:hypothetical protein